MAIYRAPENPIIRPEEIRPSRPDFEVIGVFNTGVARYREEVILLLRVAERPVAGRKDVVLSPIYDVGAGRPLGQEGRANAKSPDRMGGIVKRRLAMATLPCLGPSPRPSALTMPPVVREGRHPQHGRFQDFAFALDRRVRLMYFGRGS